MNRSDLQELADTRIREAKLLFAAGEFSGAYYLAGYAVECALKACFAKDVKQYDFPDKGRTDKVFTHDLVKLLTQTGLDPAFKADSRVNSALGAAWDEAVKWTESSRYNVSTENQAEQLMDAILNEKDGVMPWIKLRW